MKKATKFILILSIFTLFVSCDDIIEENIANDFIQINLPLDGAEIEGNTVNFSWELLDGVDKYRIQINSSNEKLVLDSLITTTTFSYVLDPGDYHWRVRGENFAYETDYTSFADFTLISSDDLTNQTVLLEAPSDGFYTNNTSITCSWNAVLKTDSYSFELLKDLNGIQIVSQQPNLTSTNLELDSDLLNEDAKYIWKVKAVNSISETVFSEKSFFIDTVSPNKPVLNTPDDQATSSASVNFIWNNGEDPGEIQSTIINTFELSSDENFNTLIHTSTTKNSSYSYTIDSNGNYFWRVIAKDMASNSSGYSNVRTITIQ